MLVSNDAEQRRAFANDFAANSSFVEIEIGIKARNAGGRVFVHKHIDALRGSQNVINTYKAAINAASFGNVVVLLPETKENTADGLFNGDGHQWELKLSGGSKTSLMHQIGTANHQATHLWLSVEKGDPNQIYNWIRGKLLVSVRNGTLLKLEQIICAIVEDVYVYQTSNMGLNKEGQNN